MNTDTEKSLLDMGWIKAADGRFAFPEMQLVIEVRGLWNIALSQGDMTTFFTTEENLLDCLLHDLTDDQMITRMCRYANRWWKDISVSSNGKDNSL